MYLVSETDNARLLEAIQAWQHARPSVLLEHDGSCCKLAQSWLLATDVSFLRGNDVTVGPRWIRDRFEWGPSQWPIFWCEAVASERLDCGVLAAFAREVMQARGLAVYPVQLIEQYPPHTSRHWQNNWLAENSTVTWIREDLVYHEAMAIRRNGALCIWDPTSIVWIDDAQPAGYGCIRAIRVEGNKPDHSDRVIWGDTEIALNVWTCISTA